jgi:hypothetical protein
MESAALRLKHTKLILGSLLCAKNMMSLEVTQKAGYGDGYMSDWERRAARGPNLAPKQRPAAEASNGPLTLKKGLMFTSLRARCLRHNQSASRQAS